MSKVIFMDNPGHGGRDPGATGKGRLEKDYALRMAQRCNTIKNKHKGVNAVLFRDKDEFKSLSEISNKSNSINADYFYSYHFNAPPTGIGIEIHRHVNSNVGLGMAEAILNELESQNLTIRNRGVKISNFMS